MSSRALRRLQNDEELLESLINSPGTEKSTPEPSSTSASRVNLFALIDDDQEESDEYGDDDNDKENGSSGSQRRRSSGDTSHTESSRRAKVMLPTKTQKKNKKKLNKKKKNAGAKNVKRSYSNEEGDDDELDRIIQQFRKEDVRKLGQQDRSDEYQTASEGEEDDSPSYTNGPSLNNLLSDSGFSKFSFKSLKSSARFFNSDFKKLDPHSEFKLLFDDLTTESLEDIDSMTSTHVTPQQLKQIQRMKRLLRNWGGKDHRSVPNGAGSNVHRLQFTKIREDWLPTPREELIMQPVSTDEVRDWQFWLRPNDWKDVIEEDIQNMRKVTSFYKFEPLDPDINRKAMTEFYLSVVLHPDHEALISLISSKYPYHVPALLQVALILVRQGDRSNTNGLIQKALFVFDRALKNGLQFDSLSCQLPYIYFFNRQFYLAIFRYILALAQRGAVATAGEWCKTLWSLSPLEDPIGCRYFIDHYILLNNEYQYLIDLAKSSLANCYVQWYTLGIALGTVLSYLRTGHPEEARQALLKTFGHHLASCATLYVEKLLGDEDLTLGAAKKATPSQVIEIKSYMARFSLLWKNPEDVAFLQKEMTALWKSFGEGTLNLDISSKSVENVEGNPLFINGIPVNLLRFAILSEESSVMASIPSEIWDDYDVYDFDVLPPTPTSRESIEVLENVKTFISDRDLAASQMNLMQDENLMNQIRQMSLEQFLEENPNAGLE